MLAKGGIIAFWSVLLFIILISSLKENIVTKNHYVLRNTFCLFPQGWGFFTRDPSTEKEVFIYAFEPDGSFSKLNLSNQSFGNYIGFSRNSRLRTYDLTNILNQLKDDNYWKSIKGSPNVTNVDSLKVIYIQKGNKIKLLSEGTYMIEMKEKIPYIWANKGQEKFVRSKITKIYLYE